MARLFLDYVFIFHGLPDTIESDHGPQLISSFWEYLTRSLGIKRKLSTAYHPQTDGQTERANQDLDNYLWRYVSWKQDDWARWLSMAEFAGNTAPSATTGILPFHAVYVYEPRMDFDILAETDTPPRDPSRHNAKRQAEALAMSLRGTWEDLKEAIRTSQARVSSRENEKRKDPALAPGDWAYLDTRHLSRGCLTRKLAYRRTGPYKVEAVCYGPPALYTFPTPYAFPASTYLMPLNPLPYLVHVPLFKSPHLTLIT